MYHKDRTGVQKTLFDHVTLVPHRVQASGIGEGGHHVFHDFQRGPATFFAVGADVIFVRRSGRRARRAGERREGRERERRESEREREERRERERARIASTLAHNAERGRSSYKRLIRI